MTPSPQNDITIDFLFKWKTEGPWVLTAIQPDRKSIDTRTFRPEQRTELARWLEAHNGKDNMYFHVNPPTRDLEKKANREDVAALEWLHVDIDPRAGEDLEEERARALAFLQDRLPTGIPEPTCIIFSGGGYQGFWRLTEPFQIDGDLPKAEEAKRWNMQLELDFGADNCHNVDRIMRLPGTINIPDAKKRKKGRVETLAELVVFNDNAYPLDQFKQAPALQTSPDMLGGGGVKVEVGGNIERIQDVSELDKWDIPDRVKVLMVQGNHPDQPKDGDNSRSAWLFDFCCQMVRHEVPDDVIFSIITDPDWGISESVVEMKANAEKYALRQIQRAKEDAIDPKLAYFNGRYAVIKKLGGKCLVVSELFDYALKRTRLVKQSLNEFANSYENEQVHIGEDANGNPKYKPAGMWWRKHPNRRQFETICFSPEEQVDNTTYNLWKGFSVQSIAGECDLFLDHVKANICAGNEEHYRYLMCWLARLFQTPATPGEVAIVLRGGRGVGKSIFAKVIGSLLGRHYMQVSNSSHLIGNFNSHLRDLVLLFADEAFYAGDKKHESILKTLVTEDTMAVEAKGVDVETAPNYIHLIMASNDMHVVPAGGDERRFFVLDVAARNQKDSAYFGALMEQMNNGGREALLHYLRHYDLDGFNVRDVPTTEALREQKLLSLDPDEEWWYQKLLLGQVLYDEDGWPDEVMGRALTDDYIEHSRRFHINKKSSETKLGRFLRRVLPRVVVTKRLAEIDVPAGDGWTRKKKVRAMFYTLPSLGECWDRWEELHGPTDWPRDMDNQETLKERSNDPPF